MATIPKNTKTKPRKPVIIEELVIAEIRARRKHGIAKYGVGMERTDLTRRQWLQHAKEEAMDFCIYLEKLIIIEDEQAVSSEKPMFKTDPRSVLERKAGRI